MNTIASKSNLMDLDRPGLGAFFEAMGEKRYRADQLVKWIHRHGRTDFGSMTDISKALRQRLADAAQVEPPRVLTEKTSDDGTRKWLLGVGCNNAVETVFIPEPNRGTLCISSQAGCSLNCTFCSTATQGFSRNLTTGEIIGQVWVAAQSLEHTQADRKITNVVFMGMGEPLMNFEPVVSAIELMRDDLAYGLAGRRITVSTAGLVPGIDRLRECTDVSLAVSLHGATDELRNRLVPLNKKYPIKELMAACRRYLDGRNRARITFEYTLIDGVNDAADDARKLVRLLRSVPSKLNLIPFNPFPGTEFQRSSEAAINRFQKIVLDAGLVATVRKTRGDDIDAACGQLVGQIADRTRRQERFRKRLAAQPLPVTVNSGAPVL